MVGLSSLHHQSAGDEIPLNKSFDTLETSDTVNSPETFARKRNVMSVWGFHAMANHHPNQETSLASDETLQIRHSKKSKNTQTQSISVSKYSPSLAADFELADRAEAFSDEPGHRALLVPRPEIILEATQIVDLKDAQEDIQYPREEFYNSMIVMKSDLNSRWRDDTPFDEQSSRQSDKFPELEAVFADGVWVDGQKVMPADESGPSPDKIEVAKARVRVSISKASSSEDLNCNEIVWSAWGCNERKKRRHVVCFIFLFLAVVAVIAFLIALIGGSESNQQNAASVTGSEAAGEGAMQFPGDAPQNQPSTPPSTPPPFLADSDQPVASPKEMPIVLSTPAPTHMPGSLTKRPVLGTVPPDLPALTLSPTPPQESNPTERPPEPPPQSTPDPTSKPTPKPTLDPSHRPTPDPTLKPTPRQDSPTPRPTTASTPRPVANPVDPPTLSPTPCQSTMTVNKACYNVENDLILVEFFNCDPQNDDWVGIWLDQEDPSNLSEDFVTWAWSCGTRSCLGAPESLRLAFRSNGIGIDTFRAFLVHETPDDEPYIARAMSESFEVAPDCT